MPIRKGDGTILSPKDIQEVRLGDGTILFAADDDPADDYNFSLVTESNDEYNFSTV